MSEHVCPPYCHKCPDLDGGVMPCCYGTVIYANNEHDMSRCDCPENNKPPRQPSMEDRVSALERAIEEIKVAMPR